LEINIEIFEGEVQRRATAAVIMRLGCVCYRTAFCWFWTCIIKLV